jgi:hypothetical protein
MNSAAVTLGILLVLAVETAGAAPTFQGGDGSNCEHAIVIRGAANEWEGVASEYRYLEERHPGWTLKGQSLVRSGDRSYDLLEFASADGTARRACFDISEFYQP